MAMMSSNAQQQQQPTLAEANRATGMVDGYDAWRREINDYQEKKQNFQQVPEPYRKVTNAHVKAQEVEYNPITQTFANPQREQQVRNIE